MSDEKTVVPTQDSLLPSTQFANQPGASQTHPIHALERLALAIEQCSDDIRRIADHICPPPNAFVDTQYVSTKIGVTKERISQMIREGVVPQHCVVEGTGNGKPWKFHRRPIDQWLRSR